MRMNLSQLRNSLSGVGHWMKDYIVSDVPDDVAVCEFDCRESECSSSKWESCQRRVSNNVVGLGHFVMQPKRPDVRANTESMPALEDQHVWSLCPLVGSPEPEIYSGKRAHRNCRRHL